MANLQSDRTSQSSKVTSLKQSSLERRSDARADLSIKLSHPESSCLDKRSLDTQSDAQPNEVGVLKDRSSRKLRNMLDVRSQTANQNIENKAAEDKETRPDRKQSALACDQLPDAVVTAGNKQSKVDILGVDFDNFSMQELLHQLKKGILFTPNVDHLMKLRHDPEFARVYQKADFKICDSQIVMYASKFLGKKLKEKLSGSDLFPLFCEHHKHNENIKIFLLGGKEGVAKEARVRVNRRIGREIVVGEYSPPFGFEHSLEECDRIINHIQASNATVIAVCLGAPKQEKWIATYSDRLPNIDIFMAVGAVVDFEAGTKPRAPKYVSDLGLEWLYRLVCEPRRLWKRYLLEDMPFIGLVLAEKLKQMAATGR